MNHVSFEELKEEIARLLAVRSLWDVSSVLALGQLFVDPKAERGRLMDEFRVLFLSELKIHTIFNLFSYYIFCNS